MDQIVVIYSFDIFDTLITRKVIHPKDIFLLMKRRLILRDKAFHQCLVKKFWGERVLSEFLARRMSEKEDVLLADIYSVVANRNRLTDEQRLSLVRLELEVEAEMMTVIEGAGEMVESARNLGDVVFISDMYLPEEFLSQQLTRFGLRKTNEPVYVSGTRGATKRSGTIFELMLSDLGVSAEQVVHYGDDPKGDNIIPRKLGICCRYDVPGDVFFKSLVNKFRYGTELVQAYLEVARG